ncbi:MAG: alpha-N-acetylglucosaminidase [Muribaculaceae bacterium]|nr:alpha-N-acetylglucosaminidase [Muribaculaceae bacterium]
MKRSLLLMLALGFLALAGASKSLDDMSRRLFGDRADSFRFINITDSVERYRVSAADGKITIEGSTPSAMAVGLNRYLRELCGTDVSWYLSEPVVLPANLPLPTEALEGEARSDMRFFLNYCTYGYTMPFWSWADWERLIDWMALQGVNMPLAIAGQEAVWQRVWRSLGLDDDTIRAYYTGPAHLPWHRMLNVDRWDGPLPQSYIDAQEALQKKIVERARELGMKPILPAFAGHVPPALGEVFPEVKIHPMSKWGGLDPEKYRSYFIEPTEALFDTIQSRFIAEQTKTFGTDHIYGLDPFNEIEVPSWEEDYLRSASERIYSTLETADPEARWLQMAWMFHYMSRLWTPERVKAFLSGVDADKMILLDYYCDLNPLWRSTDAFHGRQFIWCYLGNFGGNSFLVGDMDVVKERTDSVYAANLPNMAGVGGTLEGLDLNRHMHSYTLDRAWKHKGAPDSPDEWIEMWAGSRGADQDKAIAEAWHELYRDIYHATSTSQGSLVNSKPCFEEFYNWAVNNRIKYDNKRLVEIWKKLIDANATGHAHDYDVVNVGRQALGNNFKVLRDRFKAAYDARDVAAMRREAEAIDEAIADIDLLLACVPEFSFKKWIDDARSYGTSAEEADYYETNARRLVTTWTQTPGSLNDYANRDMTGLTGNFYRGRWRLFTDELIARVERGEEFKGKGDPFYDTLSEWEWNWAENREPAPESPATPAVSTARRLYDKYFK